MEFDLHWLPSLNATLNGLSFFSLMTGYYFIRQGNWRIHRTFMLTALLFSVLFLCSYLIYHFQVGSVRFAGQGPIRMVYFAILFSHTLLAMVIVPLVIITVRRAWKGDFSRHRKIARWTLPLWAYVSLTGVIIYWMLYHGPGRGGGMP